ncbi:type VI secretion system tip protein VgrG [Rubritalea marina]|uniref:type VI secretion system tip protein VgrG n=1 Tax=Rubritalea marina TaxID=361055 RepID=UPI00035EDCA2|nr:type VI secretion system tip protein VgrG [Rubritalea marina]
MTVKNKEIVTTKILVSGSAIADTIQVKEIQVQSSLNRIAGARIVILDGSPAKATFEVSSGSTFVPGNKIEIQAGFGTQTKTIFKGLITAQSISAMQDRGSELVVECRNEALKMTLGRKSGAFTKQSDSDVMSTLASRNGVSATVKSTTPELEQLVQYCCTDWDFLLTRAEVNSLVVVTDDDKVTVAAPETGSSVLTLTYGDDIVSIESTMSAAHQLESVSAQCWDYSSQQMVTANATSPSVPSQGNITGDTLSEVLSPKKVNLVTTSRLETQSLTNWASGEFLKSRLSKIRGTVKSFGNSDVKANTVITLKGLGDRFNGDAFVSGVEHRIEDGNWWTQITTGLNPRWFAEEMEPSYRPAAGLLPGIRGLQNAIVKAITQDPDNQIRVQVTVQSMTADSESGELWARWTQPYATNGAGFFFMPEIGDEVIVAFLNEDPRFPVILGSLYSSQMSPPTQPADDNPIKTIVTKEKLTMEMDDKNKVITIKTPGNNQCILSDKDQSITIEDQNNNKITMSSSGIEIKSASDITLNATGELKVKAASLSASYEGEAQISADAAMTIKGLDLNLTGDASFKTSAPQGQVSADAVLTLQGGMININ